MRYPSDDLTDAELKVLLQRAGLAQIEALEADLADLVRERSLRHDRNQRIDLDHELAHAVLLVDGEPVLPGEIEQALSIAELNVA